MPRITDTLVKNARLQRKDEAAQRIVMENMERGLSFAFIVGRRKKSFAAVAYEAGKPVWQVVGQAEKMSLADAREEARRFWKDPKAFRAEKELGSAAAPTGVKTFENVVDDFLEKHVAKKKLRSGKEIGRHFRRYLFDKPVGWKDRPFAEIRRREINDALDHIENAHGAHQADAVLASLRKLMNWFAARSDEWGSPIVKGLGRSEPKARERVLTDDELRLTWAASSKLGTFGALVRLCLLTGQRRSAVAAMRWDQIDLATRTWTLPQPDRAKGVGGALVLPKIAISTIEAQPRLKDNPFVLTGRGGVSFNAFSDGMEELRTMLPARSRDFTLHDLRRSARTLLARAGVQRDIAERVLGHVLPSIERIYNRHDYRDEKRDALRRLSILLWLIRDRQIETSMASNISS